MNLKDDFLRLQKAIIAEAGADGKFLNQALRDHHDEVARLGYRVKDYPLARITNDDRTKEYWEYMNHMPQNNPGVQFTVASFMYLDLNRKITETQNQLFQLGAIVMILPLIDKALVEEKEKQ